MKKYKTDILIIGAGPAGLAAAAELAKAGKDFIIIEQAGQVGGLAKTYEFREGDLIFRTDNGPHRFFSKNPALYEFIGELLGEKWLSVKRQTRQFIEGKFYDYPVNATQALKNIGWWRSCRMGWDYVAAKIKYGLGRRPISSFADYVYANFGKSLGEFNMINYTEKIWGLPATEIHLDWAGQRIKGLDLRALVKDVILKKWRGRSANQPKTLVDTFYYPDSGTGLIYETIKRKLEASGYRIMLGTAPTEIWHQAGSISKVICRSAAEGEVEITCQRLIESVPLKDFLSLLKPRPPELISANQAKLTYRNQVYLFITLDRESVTADQWIYFPEKKIPIGRMSEMRNFSAKMSPAGKTSLFLEFFCSENDEIWNRSAKELFDLALAHLVPLGFIKPEEVRKYYQLKEKQVYPIYDLAYQEYLSVIKKYLDTFANLYYIGRPGRFRYNNQDHSLEMGFLAARSIIDGKPYDIEAVGNEKEYYESGQIKT